VLRLALFSASIFPLAVINPPSVFSETPLTFTAMAGSFVITHPEGYELNPEITKDSKIEYDQDKAFENADFIYAKNWSNYKEYGKITNSDPDWTVTADKMKLTNNAKFMHCLPVRRNVIVTDEVIDSENSIVIEQANNRTYSAQLVLQKILENGK